MENKEIDKIIIKPDIGRMVVLEIGVWIRYSSCTLKCLINRLKLVEGNYEQVVATLTSLKAEILLCSTLGIRLNGGL